MIIQHNLQAINAVNNISRNNNRISKAIEKLSSGIRINRSADDSAGLAISENMRSQIRGLSRAGNNAMDGISMVQTAEGAMSGMHDILQRIRELCIQAGNETTTAEDRDDIAAEMSELGDGLDSIITNTQFNTIKLFTGAVAPVVFQVGANEGETISMKIDKTVLPHSMLIFGAAYNFVGSVHVDLATLGNSSIVLGNVDQYIANVSTERCNLGALQNRLEHTVSSLNNYGENLTASESRIRDTDMADSMMELVKGQILSQASTAMLTQANQQSKNILSLLS